MFDNVQRAISFNQRNRSGQNAEFCEEEALEKKV